MNTATPHTRAPRRTHTSAMFHFNPKGARTRMETRFPESTTPNQAVHGCAHESGKPACSLEVTQ